MNAIATALLPWCRDRLKPLKPHGRRWVLGLQGPQGSGKSTAAAALVTAMRAEGWRAVCVSIDDFYLGYDAQQALASRYPTNECLRYRGYPGTHDIALGVRVIDSLATCAQGSEVRIPVYDKSAHSGRGDRCPESRWRTVTGPFDCIVVEGWMLGFSPVNAESLEADLVVPNRYLADYLAWTERLDALVHLGVESLATIVEWRIDAERARRRRGEDALSDADATDYIRRFLPAYRRYVPALVANPPCADFLTLNLSPKRDLADARAL